MKQYDIFKSENGWRCALRLWKGRPINSHSPWFKTKKEAEHFAKKTKEFFEH